MTWLARSCFCARTNLECRFELRGESSETEARARKGLGVHGNVLNSRRSFSELDNFALVS
jgi:hypothetical protein